MKKRARKERLTSTDVSKSQNKQVSQKNVMKTSHSWWKNT